MHLMCDKDSERSNDGDNVDEAKKLKRKCVWAMSSHVALESSKLDVWSLEINMVHLHYY